VLRRFYIFRSESPGNHGDYEQRSNISSTSARALHTLHKTHPVTCRTIDRCNIHMLLHCCLPQGWKLNINYTLYGKRHAGIRILQFYIHDPVHRDSILIRSDEMQQHAGVYLVQNYSTCFGCLSHLSSGVYQTVTAASGTGHITCQKNNLPPAWPN